MSWSNRHRDRKNENSRFRGRRRRRCGILNSLIINIATVTITKKVTEIIRDGTSEIKEHQT